MLNIGPLQLDAPFVQAALSGYSDLAMRRVARRLGAAYTLNEVVLDKLVTQPGKTRQRVMSVADDDHLRAFLTEDETKSDPLAAGVGRSGAPPPGPGFGPRGEVRRPSGAGPVDSGCNSHQTAV